MSICIKCHFGAICGSLISPTADKTKPTEKCNDAPTEILPPGEGGRGGCGEDSVAGRRLVAVIQVFMWVLIHVVILRGQDVCFKHISTL